MHYSFILLACLAALWLVDTTIRRAFNYMFILGNMMAARQRVVYILAVAKQDLSSDYYAK
jgi:hypothetical protein